MRETRQCKTMDLSADVTPAPLPIIFHGFLIRYLSITGHNYRFPMQCNQLIRLAKDWYTHVKNETMAPARMMQFVDRHVKECEICREDPDLFHEIEKIREHVLPDSKLPRPFRSPNQTLSPEISPTPKEAAEIKAEGDSTADNLV